MLEARAEYGEKIVSTLSRQLTASYGPGFSRQNLFHMIRFAEAWPDLMGRTSNELDHIRAIIDQLCNMEAEADGVQFDASSISVARIKEDAGYEGVWISSISETDRFQLRSPEYSICWAGRGAR